MDIYEEALKLKQQGRSSAIATIVQCLGSSPQKEGAKMLVRDDGSILGTLGGGCIEAEAAAYARMVMSEGTPRTVPFDLTEKDGGLVCGGKILVYIEPVVPDPRLVILGAGHVGKALARLAGSCGFRVTVTDDRPEYANKDNLPGACDTVVNDFPTVFSRVTVDDGTYIVVATRGHNHDLDAVTAALRTPARYIGLLGSKRKKALLTKSLREAGFGDDAISRVIIPVGLPIGSVTPEEIAVSIMAQIIERRREHDRHGLGSRSRSGLLHANGEIQATSCCP
jgi:xanthine dehydrogenase accessory factor